MPRRGFVMLVAATAALSAVGALFVSCSLDTRGLAVASSSGSGGAGTGGAGEGGGGSEPEPSILEKCPGALVNLSAGAPTTMPANLTNHTDDESYPRCQAPGSQGIDIIYRVVPEVDGTLSVQLHPTTSFKGSLAIRPSCESSSLPIELACSLGNGASDLAGKAWVRAKAPYYVIVDGDADGDGSGGFDITFTLTACGGNPPGLEECAGGQGCVGCLRCDGTGEFWDSADKPQRCYKLVSDKLKFDDARQACLDWGGALAGINDKTELSTLQVANLVSTAEDLWVGGQVRGPGCAYVWLDGEAGVSPNLFADGEPSDGGDKRCLGLRRSSEHKVDVASCDTTRGYLCERTPSGACGNGILQPGEECDDTSARCQNCLVQCERGEFKDPLTHHCYQLIKTTGSRADAAAKCAAHGGYLASITSTDENDLVARHVNAEVGASPELWIGYASDATDTWQWTGTTVPASCSVNLPIGHQPMSCATINANGDWTSRDCASTAYGYVCEREPGG